MRRPTRVAGLLALALATTTACTSGGDDAPEAQQSFTPVAPVAVALGGAALPEPLRLGVVVTSRSARGQGTEVAGLAAGARVAQFRLSRDAAQPVELEVVDDRGTPAGALAAVQSLLDQDVAGIVYASQGAHLDAAVQAASDDGTAVLLPYDGRGGVADLPGVWRTGPSAQQAAARLGQLLSDRGLRRPVVLAGDGLGAQAAGLLGGRTVAIAPGPDLLAQARTATDTVAKGQADAIVVAASASSQAETVAALQAYDATAPVVLGPEALSPTFATRLTQLSAGGAATTSGQYFTVGVPQTDAATGTESAGFLAALRLAAQDDGVLSLLPGKTFDQQGAATADVRGHDAVLALARAAAKAGAVDPASVRTALQGLVLDAASGAAGPALDFSRPLALADEDVVVLQATTRLPDQRAGIEEPAPGLTWFPVPATG